MFPRLVRGIYVMQFCCVTDLGIDCLPLSQSRPEGVLERALLRAFLQLSFFPSQVPDVVASISGVSESRSTADRTEF